MYGCKLKKKKKVNITNGGLDTDTGNLAFIHTKLHDSETLLLLRICQKTISEH